MKTSVSAAIRGLIRYGEERGLIEESDRSAIASSTVPSGR